MDTYVENIDTKEVSIVYSDNTEQVPPTMDLIPKSQWNNEFGGYDPEFISCTNVNSDKLKIIGGKGEYLSWLRNQ